MEYQQNSNERGQVLVLIALGIVVLLGFTALAVDGSMMYSDRRFGQNGADATTLAGGGSTGEQLELANVTTKTWDCAGTAVQDAMTAAAADAVTRAADNGFVIEDLGNLPAGDPEPAISAGFDGFVVTTCVSNGTIRYIDVIVKLQIQTDTSFVHFVYQGPVTQTVHSVTRVRPRTFLAFGNAVVALNGAACSGQSEGTGLHGGTGNPNDPTNLLFVQGGGIWSNGCLRVDGFGTPPPYELQIEGGDVNYFDCPNNCGVGDIQLEPGHTANELGAGDGQIEPDAYTLAQEPNCSHADAHNVTISGNNDPDLAQFVNTGSPIHDLWCITGDVSLQASDKIWGTDVTLYFVNGSLSLGGQADLNVSAVDTTNLAYNGPAIPGVVIYSGLMPTDDMLDGTNTVPLCSIDITGGTDSDLSGIVLAPACTITALGNASLEAYDSQIIGWNVEVGGASQTNIIFDENQAYAIPTYIDLWR